MLYSNINNEAGSRATEVDDLHRRLSSLNASHVAALEPVDNVDPKQQVQFDDLLKFIDQHELRRPVTGHLKHLNVTVLSLRNVTLG